MSLQQVMSAIFWATLATVISLSVSMLLIWWFGVSPRRLAREIDDVQNAGVGAVFFVVSLIISMFVSVLAGGPTSATGTPLEEIGWIVIGVVIATVYTLIAFLIAHRVMAPKGETLHQYLHREIVMEQNAALALFLGGLAIAPFLAMLYQII